MKSICRMYLFHMWSVSAFEESTLLSYTSEWIAKINRGGLFEINDTAYLLFCKIEVTLRGVLTKHLNSSLPLNDPKEELVALAIKDEDIIFYWSMLSTDNDSEEASTQLLKEIVALWLTIRGFSIAGQWIEIYKKCAAQNTKKSKSLRTSLKKNAQKTD